MANPYGSPVRFTKEVNVWDLFAIMNVGSGGALNIARTSLGAYVGKGIANVWQNTPTFTGVTSSGSSTITSISSFAGIYTGMGLSGPGTTYFTQGQTVGTISVATGSIVVNGGSANAFTGSTGATMAVQGGQYIFQFGLSQTIGSLTQNARLDTYNKLFDINLSYACDVASSVGTATQAALAPNALNYFVSAFNLQTKTVPSTSTSGSTDASITLQLGNGSGPSFVAATPQAGTVMRVNFTLSNTTTV